MVYAGTTTITYFTSGKTPVIHIAVAGIDADSEASAAFDAFSTGFDWIPNAAVLIPARTAGSTDVIDLEVQGSWNGTNYVADLAVCTSSSTPVADFFPNQDMGEPIDTFYTFRYWKVVCTTVGAGNTLTGHLYLYNTNK